MSADRPRRGPPPDPGRPVRSGSWDRAGSNRPARVGELVDRFLEAKGLKEQVGRMDALDLWSERVGEAVARVTRPRAVVDATLVVEVRSSAWLTELSLMKEEILRRLNQDREGALAIERIRFVLGEEPGDEERSARRE